jgi:hypothetical protein
MAYGVVFRKRVIEYKDAGHTFKEVNEPARLLEGHPDRYLRKRLPIPIQARYGPFHRTLLFYTNNFTIQYNSIAAIIIFNTVL